MSTKNFNVPNILSVFRLLLVPVAIVLIVKSAAERSQIILTWALACFLLACITDLVDGYVARKFKLISRLGMWLDPLADKLMSLGVVCAFAFSGIMPIWVMIVLLSKELIMLIGGFFIIRNGHNIPSNKFGKIAAFIMNVAVAACFICYIPWWCDYYLYFVYFGLALSVLSMVQYAVKNGKKLFYKAEPKIADEEREQ